MTASVNHYEKNMGLIVADEIMMKNPDITVQDLMVRAAAKAKNYGIDASTSTPFEHGLMDGISESPAVGEAVRMVGLPMQHSPMLVREGLINNGGEV